MALYLLLRNATYLALSKFTFSDNLGLKYDLMIMISTVLIKLNDPKQNLASADV